MKSFRAPGPLFALLPGLLLLQPWTAARAQAPASPPVVVSAQRTGPGAAPASVSTPDLDHAARSGAGRLEDLAAEVPGMQVQTTDGGLTSAIGLRGFTVTRFTIDGLPEVGRMFVRDLATVDTVRVLRGPDAVASGIGSPGGSVAFTSRLPQWQAQQRVQAGVGDDGSWRLGLDSTGPLAPGPGTPGDPLAYRLVAQWQGGRTDPGGLTRQRHALLGAVAWRHALLGRLTLQAEQHHNRQPFLFGTVLQDGRPLYGRLLASPDERALRRTGRQALHWQQDWPLADGDQLQARLDLAHASVQRDETLIGFFTTTGPDRLSGYYTRYADDFTQRDARLQLQWRTRLAGLPQVLALVWSASGQRFLFRGVQNINGFGLSASAPDFSAVDLAALRLTPRYRSERAHEHALALQDSVQVAPGLVLDLGLRRLAATARADRTGAGLALAARVHGTVWQASLQQALPGAVSLYLSHGQSLEPNRGSDRFGGFLSPQRAAQWEAGLHWQPAGGPELHAAAYRITLAHLPMADPLDRTALATTGLRRVQGLEASLRQRLGGWQWQAQLNLQRSANLVKTAADQGDAFAGVAGRSAALRGEGQLPWPGGQAPGAPLLWLQWQALGPRWADAANTLRLPGHALADLGLQWRQGALAWSLGVQNLFDRDHVATITAPDNVYQGPRRRLWLGLSATH